ncbi:MAG: PAS domain-containing protein, partial [Spirochaetales bacterium]
QEAEYLWRFALEGAGHGVWDWHIPTNTVYFSPQWKRMLGYEDNEIPNRYEEWESRVHPDDLKRALQAVQDLLERRVEIYHCEHRLRCKNGTYRWILDRGKVMEWDPDGKPIRAVGTHTDIHEIREAEEHIRSLLKEKELLLRETHHRVFNNLSVIRSLLSLQAGESRDPKTVAALQEAQGKIDSMRILYEKLFRSRQQRALSALDYLRDLVKDISMIFPVQNRIRITVEGEETILSPRQLVPLGIIVNELITNALKYAFPKKKKGEVYVNLRKEGNRVIVHIQDTGVGFPEAHKSPEGNFAIECGSSLSVNKAIVLSDSKGFGLELVSVLAEQLGGVCRMESKAGKGTRFSLTFTAEPIASEGF